MNGLGISQHLAPKLRRDWPSFYPLWVGMPPASSVNNSPVNNNPATAKRTPCMPPGAASPGPRPSRVSRWRALVLVGVHIAIAAHVMHWWLNGKTLSPLEPSEAMEFSKNSVINAGLLFFAISSLATLIFGRFFCGWACHLVALQDLCFWMLGRVGLRPRPMRARLLLLVPFAAFFYMFLFPTLYRWWYGQGFAEPHAELMTSGFWDTFPPWPIAVLTLVIAGFSIIYFLGAKGFCAYACPYGALYGALDRLAPGRIRVTDACKGCGHCTQACTSDVQVHAEVREFSMVVDAGCMKCLDCVSVCPEDALYFGFGKPSVLARRRPASRLRGALAWCKGVRWSSYSWREELALALLFAGTFVTFRGLYDSIPFLFSLAIAGIASFCFLQLARLGYAPRVRLQQFELKSGGQLTRAGRGFLGLGILGLLFTAHSAVVQHHRAAAESIYDELYPLITTWLSAPRPLTSREQALAQDSIEHIESLRTLAPLALFPREAWRVAMMDGWLHLLLDDDATFEAQLEKATGLIPAEAAAFNGLANFCAARGRVDEAAAWFERQTAAAPEDAEGWRLRASWLASDGREALALETLRRGTQVAEEPSSLWLELAKRSRDLGDEAAALPAFEEALTADSTNREARYLLGSYFYDLGRPEDCAREYERLILDTPGDTHLLLQTALVNMELGRWERARTHAQAASLASPAAPEPWVALSQIAQREGRMSAAEAHLARAKLLQEALDENRGPR
ncbi:MAG TPA: 4Fe-4S binding protein [Planctomycetes bacterium]|nr:4Fe-4S binding protein [Planctomycetota bacterium]